MTPPLLYERERRFWRLERPHPLAVSSSTGRACPCGGSVINVVRESQGIGQIGMISSLPKPFCEEENRAFLKEMRRLG